MARFLIVEARFYEDIADELGDHLACALHRELVKTGDEDEAQDRVLERFGDPIADHDQDFAARRRALE